VKRIFEVIHPPATTTANPLLDLPQDVEDRLFAEAGGLIPECVLAIADYWCAARTAPHLAEQLRSFSDHLTHCAPRM
jgi:hypothetical protein